MENKFKIDNIRFTLALDKNYTLNDAIVGAEKTLTRLQKYVENNYSCNGLDFKYKSIKKFK